MTTKSKALDQDLINNEYIAVIISDVHLNHKTEELAAAALIQAIEKANELYVPLVIAGDLNDTKCLLRAECVNRLLLILQMAIVPVYILIGNHDRINEKAEAHSLEFLKQVHGVIVVDTPRYVSELKAYLIPYQHDTGDLRRILADCTAGSTIIMHQGILGAFMGEYVVDKSSIEPKYLAPFRVISGHYHRRQTIETDGKKHAGYFEIGTFNYIGTPYSITHAEANDGPKGFRIYREHSLDFIPCGLRKHVKLTMDHKELADRLAGVDYDRIDINPEDILWLQVKGPASELDRISKRDVGAHFLGHQNFKLDPIYDEAELLDAEEIRNFTDEELLDKIIQDSEETDQQKLYLKQTWREII